MRINVPAWPIVALLFIGHLYVGISYVLGTPMQTSSGSFAVVKQWFPIEVWGWLIIAGILGPAALATSRSLFAAIVLVVSAIPLMAFAAGLYIARLDGVSQGVGGAALFFIPAALHVILAYSVRRDHQHTRIT